MNLQKVTADAYKYYLIDLKRFDGHLNSFATSQEDLLSAAFYQGLASVYLGKKYRHDDVVNQPFEEDKDLFGVATNEAIATLAHRFIENYDIYLSDNEDDNFAISGGQRYYFTVKSKGFVD